MAGNIKSQIGGAGSTTGGSPINSTRRIDTTSPLAGGGDLSADRTLSINTSAFALIAANNLFTGANRFTGGPTRFADVITGPLQVSGMLFVYGQVFIGSQSGASRVLTQNALDDAKVQAVYAGAYLRKLRQGKRALLRSPE